MIRVGYLIQDEEQATSFYRGLGPFNALMKKYPEITFEPFNKTLWTKVSKYDLVYFFRPSTQNDINFLYDVGLHNVPTWVDYDDDLLAVPTDNPAHSFYSTTETKQSVVRALSMANLITVSTSTLRESFIRLYSENAPQAPLPTMHVIQNAFNDTIFKRRKPVKPREKIILWRGSDTHVVDLLQIKESIMSIAEEYQDYYFYFIGQLPWMFKELLDSKRAVHVKTAQPARYMALIEELAPKVMIVPLADNQFNKSKSNIAWMEGSFAGANVVAPDFPEFKVPGCIKYQPELFHASMKTALDEDNKLAETSWKYIEDNLTLTKINKQRMDLIQYIVKK